MKKSDGQDRGFGDLAKSALGGLTTFGTEMGRLVGKGAKSAWSGARRASVQAKDTASKKTSVARVKASEKASEAKVKASELMERASEKASELKEKAAASDGE